MFGCVHAKKLSVAQTKEWHGARIEAASRHSYRGGDDPAATGKQLKELKSYDPDNTVVYLLIAFIAGEPVIENTGSKKGIAWEPLGNKLAKNDEWIKKMGAAFRAPKYDSYFQRHQELARKGWKKKPGLSLGAIAIGLLSHSVPNALQIQT